MILILGILGFFGLIALVYFIIAISTHDYTKDEKGRDKKEKIDDFLLKP